MQTKLRPERGHDDHGSTRRVTPYYTHNPRTTSHPTRQELNQGFVSPKKFPQDPSLSLSSRALEEVRFDLLARLPIPPDYPEEPLLPILLPKRMDLQGLLDFSAGVSEHHFPSNGLT